MGEILECLKAPKGQTCPADVIGNAVRVMEIATGQREEEIETAMIPQMNPNKALWEKGDFTRIAESMRERAERRSSGGT